MKDNPFFNIVIPTKERAETLQWTLKSCLDQDYPHYNIIVSDNCSKDNTSEIVSSFKSNKILYFKTPHRLSMSHNWEFALNQVKDGYVILLGDDDGLVKNSLSRLAKLIKKTQCKAYRLSNITFYWEGNIISNPFTNGMCYNVVLDNKFEYIDSNKLICKICSTLEYCGREGFLMLPSIYHGCIHLDLIKEIREKNNNIFFYSNCPDMSSALAVASNIPKFIHYYAPVCINGLSKFSNGLSAQLVADKSNNSELEIDRFVKENPIPFSPFLISDIEIVKKYLIPRPLLVADQFYKLKEIHPHTPVPPIEVVISASINYMIKYYENEKKFDSFLHVVRQVAQQNNKLSFLEEILNKVQIPDRFSINQVNNIVFNYDQFNRLATINTKHFGLKNVYDLSLFISQIFDESKSLFFHKPKLAKNVYNTKYMFYYNLLRNKLKQLANDFYSKLR